MDPEFPDQFICPILQTLFEDPVLTLDGHTFENKAIKQWFSRGNLTNPLTNNKLDGLVLIPNRSLKIAVEKFKNRIPLMKADEENKNHLIKFIKLLEEKLNQNFKIEENKEKWELQELRKVIAKQLSLIQIQRKKLQEQRLNFELQKKKFYNQISKQKNKKVPIIEKPNIKVIQNLKVQKPELKFPQRVTRSTEKPLLNIVLMGQVDCGKSTLLGSFLYRHGGVQKINLDQFKKIEKECEELGRMSMKYAWILDKDKESREKCITTVSKKKQIETQKYLCNFIDTPGVSRLQRNFIKSLTQGDVGLLVISAVSGEFQISISKDGSAVKSALLAFTVGIKKLIVCFNKFENKGVMYSESRFKEMKTQVENFLKKIGFNINQISFIPISAWNGQNFIQKSPTMPWYKGFTLIQAINNIQKMRRLTDKPLRLMVEDVYTNKRVIIGKILSGNLKVGQKIVIAPQNITAHVKSIQVFDCPVASAQTGQIIGVQLEKLNKKTFSLIKSGSVVGLADNDPPHQVSSLLAQVIFLQVPNRIKKGSKFIFSIGTASTQVELCEFVSLIDRRTGKVLIENPQQFSQNQSGMIQLKPMFPLTCERFMDYPFQGRFSLLRGTTVSAVGVIKEVQKVYNTK